MLQVNLSNLSGPELRRLLDATRSRGEAALSYQILQEMAARREDGGGRGPFHPRRPAEPRVIDVDLGDPMERNDEVPPMPIGRRPVAEPKASAPPPPKPKAKAKLEPEPGPSPRRSGKAKTQVRETAAAAKAAPVAEAAVKPAQPLEPERPRIVIDDTLPEPAEDEAANDWDVRLRPPEPDSPRAPRRLRRGHAAGFAAGAAAGIVLGWGIAATTHEAPPMPAAAAAHPIRTAALAHRPQPAPAPVVPAATTPEPAPEVLPEPAAAAPEPNVPVAPVAAPVAPDVDLKATGEAMELPQAPEARKAEETKTAKATPAKATPANACAAQPTPADQEICASPKLQRLQRDLRRAYAEALQAHQDRALLRERQLAWREARNTVSDPDRLAKLYEQRIHKLNAATAAARQQR